MLSQYFSKLQNYKIILGSQSENRKKIMTQAGIINFEIFPSNFAEDLPKQNYTESANYVSDTSKYKLLNLIEQIPNQEKQIIITADTIISLNNKIIEKPTNLEDNKQILLELTKNINHQVQTALWLCIRDQERQILKFKINTSQVYFKSLSDKIIESYVETQEGMGKAGGYAIQGLGAGLIDKIDGDFYAIWGLSIKDLNDLLVEAIEEFEYI